MKRLFPPAPVTISALALALVCACASRSSDSSDQPANAADENRATATGPAGANSGTAATGPTAPAEATEPEPVPTQNVLVVTDPAALAPVAAAGGDLGTLLAGAPVSDNRALARSQRYGSIAKRLSRDIKAIEKKDAKAGVGIPGNSHRLFDWRWLDSETSRYDLIGVVYRIDRIPLRTDDRCGDVHMIYRLAYTTEVSGESVTSRVPMTMVVFLPGPAQENGNCQRAALAWRAPASHKGQTLGEWLVSDQGPLGSGQLTAAAVERVRINMQSVRWPSAVRPDLGGHAEYILRSFVPAPGATGTDAAMQPLPLENTPDVKRLRKDKALRAELRQWIADNLDAIDAGTAAMPERFLTTRSDSVTPRGLSRRANRPFRQLFAPADFAELALAGRKHIGSPEALVRRLDDLTCAGCHQSRTIAGFHLLGKDPPEVAAGNALALYMSTHLHDEIHRRSRVLDALAENRPPDYARAFAERGPHDRGQVGSRCGLGDPGFADWTCAEGLACDPYDAPKDDRAVGTCMSEEQMDVGEPCEFGPLRAHRDSHRDRGQKSEKRSCAPGAVCNTNRVGFPGGMCTSRCADLSDTGACGVIALLHPFNMCLARKKPFPTCLAEHVAPAGLRACDRERPCRDDYICSRTPDGEGACIPPYFLFQMRVDGHP